MAPKRKAREQLAGHLQKVPAHEGHASGVRRQRGQLLHLKSRHPSLITLAAGQRRIQNEQNNEQPQQASSSNQHPNVTDHERADQHSLGNSTNTRPFQNTRLRTKERGISQQRPPHAASSSPPRPHRYEQHDQKEREEEIQTRRDLDVDANHDFIFDTALNVLRIILEYESSRTFLVYAHENEHSEKKASQKIAQKLINWLNCIGTNLQSDQLPKGSDKGTFFCHSVHDEAVHDILHNQMCLLPRRIHSESVDKVILCGSELLAEYMESDFYQTYRKAIHYTFNDVEKTGNEIKESWRQIVENSLDKPGFHHVLTEVALLELPEKKPETSAKIIPVELNGECNKILPANLFPPTNVRIKSTKAYTEVDLHKKLFTLLPRIFERKDSAIKKVEMAYHMCMKIPTDSEMYRASVINKFYHEVFRKLEDDMRSISFGDFITKLRYLPAQMTQIQGTLKFLQEKAVSAEEREQLAREEKCHQALFPLGMDYSHQKDQNPQRVPGTCLWALEHENYFRWKDNNTQRLLWISADAGCGKSVLSRCIVDEDLPKTLHRTRSCIIYFFFKDTSDDQRSARKALLSLLHQLISQRHSLIKYVLPLYKEQGDKIKDASFSKIWSILMDSVKDRETGQVICLLDALDECRQEEREDLISSIGEFCISEKRSPRCDLRFLITSRPYLDLKAAFANIVNTSMGIQLDGTTESEQIKMEIDLVIKHRVAELDRKLSFPVKVRDYLQKTLLEMEQRTYLWLRLVLDSLPKRWPRTVTMMKKEITTLPKGIDAAYESLLTKCDDEEYTRKVLEIVLAAYRPLTLKEISEALCISEETRSYSSLDLEDEESLQELLPGRCGLMITIIDSKVYFIHQTVKEFLLKKVDVQDFTHGRHKIEENGAPQESVWNGSFTNQQSHYRIAMACMRTLLFPEISTKDFDACQSLIETYQRTTEREHGHTPAFFSYTALYWADHYRDCQRRIDIEKRLVPKNVLISSKESQVIGTVAQVAAAGQHEQIFNLHIDDISNIDEITDGQYGTLLVAAAYGGNIKITRKVLVDRRAEINTQGGREMVELLLSRGAEVNTQGGSYGTALQAASGRGHREIVELLLSRGAEVNIQGGHYGTALQAAIVQGHREIVELLLSRGAEVNTQGGRYGTALQAASGRGHREIVELLLSRGAK
ncbi:hypothetical protein BP5796_04260 [Coleophoma crateriformis]|uniref:Uncharacterized protein n=1 Tax=Coleophoma crateriformis TaxID=565419 RepID=A0A3D8SHV8_9HELO|nr:hypothetical protein BP5796_04260 [Coleophoma crateriformis]